MVSQKRAADRAAKAAASLPDQSRDLYKQQFLQIKEQQAAFRKRMLEDPNGVLAEIMAAQEQHNFVFADPAMAAAHEAKRKLEGDSDTTTKKSRNY